MFLFCFALFDQGKPVVVLVVGQTVERLFVACPEQELFSFRAPRSLKWNYWQTVVTIRDVCWHVLCVCVSLRFAQPTESAESKERRSKNQNMQMKTTCSYITKCNIFCFLSRHFMLFCIVITLPGTNGWIDASLQAIEHHVLKTSPEITNVFFLIDWRPMQDIRRVLLSI